MKGIYTITLTTHCNRSCSYCIAGCPEINKKALGSPGASFVADKEWVIKTANAYDGIIALSGGEPLSHPDIDEIIDSIKKQIVIYTNGDLIDNHKHLLNNEKVFWILSTHPKYRNPTQFAIIRNEFPIDRTIIHHLAFDEFENSIVLDYISNYKYFQSDDTGNLNNTKKYNVDTCTWSYDDYKYIINNSQFAEPDGFIYNGVCNKSFKSYEAIEKTKDAQYKIDTTWEFKIPKHQWLSTIENSCGKTCNSIRTNLIINKMF